MDKTRMNFINVLRAADKHGRLRAYSPVTTLGRTIIVHAKLTIIDDVLLRIGSSNINNRSLGFDTECDMSFEAVTAEAKFEVTRLRNTLLAHWLGCVDGDLEAAIAGAASVGDALEALRTGGYTRLRPIEARPLHGLAEFIAVNHLGDPVGPDDSWRPWKRRKALLAQGARARRQIRLK
jgi:phosphatidylserine/phosphatidylglycerophosphate/cardiolipin synthase-like enzyme